MSAKDDFPYLMYDAVEDEDTTEICRRLDGKIYLATDPIWNDIYPGNHYQCRSGVISMTEEEFLEDNLELSDKVDQEIIEKLGHSREILGDYGNPWKRVLQLKRKILIQLAKI